MSSVTGIGSNNINDAYTTNTTAKEKAAAEKPAETTGSAAADKVTSGTGAAASDKTAAESAGKTSNETAAVYDKSKLSEDDRKTIVAQLKADQEKRQTQFTQLIQDMMSKQTNTFGAANNIWRFLAKGDFTVDAATKKKAQEDISEDGYWGVKQTSDRIVQFATALAGNDSKQLEKMRDAFLKGYKKAEKTWGGKLPDISKRTYDAVLEKFDKLMKPAADTSTDKQASSKPNSNANQSNKDTVTTTEDGTVVSKN